MGQPRPVSSIRAPVRLAKRKGTCGAMRRLLRRQTRATSAAARARPARYPAREKTAWLRRPRRSSGWRPGCRGRPTAPPRGCRPAVPIRQQQGAGDEQKSHAGTTGSPRAPARRATAREIRRASPGNPCGSARPALFTPQRAARDQRRHLMHVAQFDGGQSWRRGQRPFGAVQRARGRIRGRRGRARCHSVPR